jgi:hypothetical protein
MVNKNDAIILDRLLGQRHKEIAPDIDLDEYFELFVAEQILKDYDPSYDEIKDGNTGDTGDGGIDGIYVFVNGEYVQDGKFKHAIRENILIHLVIIQAKNKSEFEERVIEKLLSVAGDLLDLSSSIDILETFYSPKVIEIGDRFRLAYAGLADRFPDLRVTFCYVNKGSRPTPNMERKARQVEERVKDLFRKAPSSTKNLRISESPIATDGSIGFICLVNLFEYYQFIIDKETKALNQMLFEANVRDWEGDNSVNRKIRESLEESTGEDFWWLNNGVTIIASRATMLAKTIQIENPEIVNGLQTSRAIYNYFSSNEMLHNDNRSLLIRVLVPEKPDSREQVIRATNSQTKVPDEALRSTDRIHRNIEEYLLGYQIFYDRRKNYYKNILKKPVSRIIGIKRLGQAVISVALLRPDDARARPNDWLGNDDRYKLVFSEGYPLGLYFLCAFLLLEVEKILRSDEVGDNYDIRTRRDMVFHILMYVVLTQLGFVPTLNSTELGIDHDNARIKLANAIGNINPTKIPTTAFIDAAHEVLRIFTELGATNKVAKGTELVDKLRYDLEKKLNRRR